MVPTIYNKERLAFDHRQELRREAEHERKLADLPRRHVGLLRLIIGNLGDLLVTLSSSMKRFKQRSEPVLYDL